MKLSSDTSTAALLELTVSLTGPGYANVVKNSRADDRMRQFWRALAVDVIALLEERDSKFWPTMTREHIEAAKDEQLYQWLLERKPALLT